MIRTRNARNGTEAKSWLMWVRIKIIQSKEWTRSRHWGLSENGGEDDSGFKEWCPGVDVRWMLLTLIEGDSACQQASVRKQWLSPTVSLPFFDPSPPLSDLFLDSCFFSSLPVSLTDLDNYSSNGFQPVDFFFFLAQSLSFHPLNRFISACHFFLFGLRVAHL